MQGVRSTRGCINCRRRKKGCDFKRPVCGRCRRLNVACRYEERHYTFVGDGGASSSRISPPSEPSTTPPPHVPAITSQSSLTATDLDMQVDAGFWNIYLPQEDPMLDGSIDGVRSAPWIPTVRALADEDGNVRTAIRAVEYAGLGWMYEDYSLVQHGLKLYAQALRETNGLLQDPANAQSDAVLASCRTLSLFEMFRRSPNATRDGQSQVFDWRSHVEGTCLLVQLRGPQKHISGHGLNLYDGVRMTAVIQGIARHESNAFTNLQWDLPSQKNLRDELFDSMSSIPALLQQIDLFGAVTNQHSESGDQIEMMHQGRNLLQRIVTVCAGLRDWERRVLCLSIQNDASTRTEPWAVETDGSEASHQLKDVCLSHGFGFFFLCTQYWAMCIKVYSTALVLQGRMLELVETSDSDYSIPHLPEWVDPEPSAQNIADTASHYFRPEAGLWSAQSAIFPIGTAMGYFAWNGRQDSSAFKKLIGAFADNKPGAIMRDFLQSTLIAVVELSSKSQ